MKRNPNNRQLERYTECRNCGGDLVEGDCAFCPAELDDDRDREFTELDSYFRPDRTD